MISWLTYVFNIIVCRLYLKSYYFYYRLCHRDLRNKIIKILKLNKESVVMNNDGQEEQALPGFTKCLQTGYYKYMFARYLYSIKYIRNKVVLDCASGLGWGSFLISKYPKKLLSIDINSIALDFANAMWNDNKLNFVRHSMLELENLNLKFDVILGYEAIEHLNLNDGRLFIKQAVQTLSENGILILSSYFPNHQKKAIETMMKNKYHLHIYTREEMKDILIENGISKIRFLGDFMIVAKR